MQLVSRWLFAFHSVADPRAFIRLNYGYGLSNIFTTHHTATTYKIDMEWQRRLLDDLKERDDWEKKDNEKYSAFYVAAKRAIEAEKTIEILKTGDAQEEIASLQKELVSAKQDLDIVKSEKGTIQDELANLKLKSERDSKLINQLQKSSEKLKTVYSNKLEELQEQKKMLQLANDEILSYNIQLNLLEQKCGSLTKENEQLVQRWMDKATSDANKMNEANAFLESVNKQNSLSSSEKK